MVLPQSLQRRALQIAHEGHQGVSKTKSLVRTKVWFPGIDVMVEEMVAGCLACQFEDGDGVPQPIQVTPLPEKARTDLAMDFFWAIAKWSLFNGCR